MPNIYRIGLVAMAVLLVCANLRKEAEIFFGDRGLGSDGDPFAIEPFDRHCNSTDEPQRREERIAVLISGQCHRFIYRDQSGPLFGFSSNRNRTEPKVDVYIFLQCASNNGSAENTIVQPYQGFVENPPYMLTLNITDIEYWYKRERGASKVTVKTVDDAHMEEMDRTILKHATNLFQNRRQKIKFNLTEMALNERVWKSETRKFYNRHVVYTMAAEHRDRYSGFVYMREDNYFLQTLNLDEAYFGNNRAFMPGLPFVAVDRHCMWYGAYSDKLYVANQMGADLLFAPSFPEFIERMKRYVLFWYYRHTGSTLHFRQPQQAEAYVADTLSTAHVETMDMLRMDVRYNNGQLCVPKLYLNCMPKGTQALSKLQGLGMCDETRRQEARARNR
jgi:hypothetical protein